MNIEGSYCMFVKGSYKDCWWEMLQTNLFHYVEAVCSRHLDIQEEQVDRLRLKIGDGLSAILTLGNDLNVLMVGQQQTEQVARQRLIIDNDGSQHQAVTRS
jgi:hypothetical protein